jgi:hypothetical protein
MYFKYYVNDQVGGEMLLLSSFVPVIVILVQHEIDTDASVVDQLDRDVDGVREASYCCCPGC